MRGWWRLSQMPASGWSQLCAEPVDEPDGALPHLVGDADALLVGEMHGVERLAVDVELELVGGAVADPHRAGAAVALQVVEDLLVQVGGAVHPVHDLQRVLVVAGLADPFVQPVHVPADLLGEAEAEQRVHRERRVAHPGVAVVPVAGSADQFGQRGGGCGDHRAGRRVRHELQRDGRAFDHLPPAAGVAGAFEPAPPVVPGPFEHALDLFRAG